jgi:hypothetical protein
MIRVDDPQRQRRWPAILAGLVCALVCACVSGTAFAQEPDEKQDAIAQEQASKATPAQPKPKTTQPASTDPRLNWREIVERERKRALQTPPAKVIEVGGTVDWAPAGVSPLETEGWTPVATGDLLPAGTQIRTGLRSHVNLRFGEATYVNVRSATYAAIEQFYRTATTELVRVGLGYGTVRGGSSEGEVRSDVVVDSPTATLAKRGTEGWQIFVEAGTGRFEVSLAQRGLIEAIQKLRGERAVSRLVRPGEFATHDTIAIKWFEQEKFNREVVLVQAEGITDADAAFTVDNSRGFGVIAPGSGFATETLAARNDRDFVLTQIDENFPEAQAQRPALQIPSVLGIIPRPEGNFGTRDVPRSNR